MELSALVNKVLDTLLNGMTSPPNVDWSLELADMFTLCAAARTVFMNESMLLRVDAPIQVCGDIHGQFYDLLRIFESQGAPPKTRYLFLGDYVDRGKHSLEVICLLFALKIKFPRDVFLLRGNHECDSITKQYGFFDECKRRFTVKLWKTFVDVFNCMPVAAIVADKVFCVHGGLSPDLEKVADINKIERPTNIPDEGLLCDLLWSDPEADLVGWTENDRGVSYLFGKDVVERFLEINSLELVCRAHQVVEDGYDFLFKRQLITIFSAPCYMGEFDNAGGVLEIDESLRCRIQVFTATTSNIARMV